MLVWSCFEIHGSAKLGVFAALMFACGREDIELGSRPSVAAVGGNGNEPGDTCSAAVPPDLISPRPPLGWNGYNAFGCSDELDEAKVKANVEAIVSSGMQAAGYEYVVLDECWQLPRAADGSRVFDPERLPGGIESLSRLLRERGLSLGVFASVHDCLDTPGSDGFEMVDAQSYASWGVKYVKYVACPGTDISREQAARLGQALSSVSPPIVLSLASPPFAEWMPRVAQLWRTGRNARAEWSSIVDSIDVTTPLAAYARPGAFNDPDMLEIGNGSLTEGEQRVQFSVWSILAAPLFAGNDLSLMNDATRAILTNTDVIALDQDPLGLQGALVRSEGDVDILAKPLAACGARGVVLWNRGTSSATVTLSWSEIWLAEGPTVALDLWQRTEIATGPRGLTVEVPPHDAVALRVTGSEPPLPRGEVFLSDVPWTYAVSGFGPIELDTSNGEEAAGDGVTLRLRGAAYDKGIGTHAPSLIRYRLERACRRFTADVGIDDETSGRGSVQFEVWADGVRLFESGTMTGTSPPKRVDVNLTGRREMRLFVGIAGDAYGLDHADWANALLTCDDFR
jgi:alpha-galactosidase